jgi:hypothetical protein
LGEGAELSFPFSLTIPKYTFNYGGHRKNKHWAASAHELPPTVATHGFRFDGRIGYELYAEARKSTFFSINARKRKSIFLRRRGEPSSPSPCLQTMEQTLALQKSSTFKLPSLRRRNDKSSNESELIHQSTTLKVQVPSSMELGNPISMALEVVQDGQDANALLIPEVHLLSIKHNIEVRTYVRVPGLAKDDDSGIK